MAPRDEDIGWSFGEPVDGTACEKVSVEVKRDMMGLLMEFKDKKKGKNRMDREFEENLIKSMSRPIDDDEEEDLKLAYAMRQSREQHKFEYYHPRNNYYHEGDVRAPSAYELARVYLPEECKEMKNYINSFEPVWNERGVTIMCDGWSGPTNMHIINFLVYSVRGTVFHKSIDATDVYCRDTNYYYSLMEKVVQEIGEEKVVQIVTDNEASVKAAGKKLMDRFPHLYWTACTAHCLDLLLEDIGKKSSIKSVIERARKVSQFIYKYKWAVDYMKKFTGGRDLTRPGITRFATQFIMLESVVRHKTALQEMFDSSTWVTSRFGQMNDALAVEVRETLSKHPSTEVAKFWEKADEIIKIQEPIIKVLKLVDGDLKPTVGFIYEAMERCKLAIQKNCTYYKNYWKMIDKRWNCQLHTDLHAAGCFLNPQYMYGENDIGNDHELLVGIYMYRDKAESFGNSSAQREIHQMDPAMWWMTYGDSAPELRKIVVRVLSQTTSSSNCERNWSMWSLVHTKTRNRLKYGRLHQIVYLRYNMKLKLRHMRRHGADELKTTYDPINLDYIFDVDDPLNEWLEESKAPLFEGDELSWLDYDDGREGGDGGGGSRTGNTVRCSSSHQIFEQSRQSAGNNLL
uniref:DUF659 domain-containing protein n=1 Tax=Chenopodium quinoa TaxID=63459 RepID=A0A803LRA4_CHEQI